MKFFLFSYSFAYQFNTGLNRFGVNQLVSLFTQVFYCQNDFLVIEEF